MYTTLPQESKNELGIEIRNYQIRIETEIMNKQIEDILKKIENLNIRLEPVSFIVPSDPKASVEKDPILCQLAADLHCKNNLLSTISSKLSGMIENLEL